MNLKNSYISHRDFIIDNIVSTIIINYFSKIGNILTLKEYLYNKK